MKFRRLVAIVLLIMSLSCASALASYELITYEQLISGDYNGQTVEVRARPFHLSKTYAWEVETEEGKYHTIFLDGVDWSYKWIIYESEYKSLAYQEKHLLDNGDPCVLEVALSDDGEPTVKWFGSECRRHLSHMSKGTIIEAIIVFVIIGAIFAAVMGVFDGNKKSKKYPVDAYGVEYSPRNILYSIWVIIKWIIKIVFFGVYLIAKFLIELASRY